MRLSETVLFNGVGNIDEYDVHIKKYERGELIFPEDITEIGIVLNGCLRVYKNDLSGGINIVEYIEPGEIVFEPSAEISENLTYICARKTDVAYFNKNSIFKEPQLAERLTLMITDSRSRLRERAAVLCGRSIRDKLKCYFEIIAAREKKKCFNLSVTMSELANLLSVDRSAMSREIKKMKEENLVKIEKHTVSILWEIDF